MLSWVIRACLDACGNWILQGTKFMVQETKENKILEQMKGDEIQNVSETRLASATTKAVHLF